MSCFMLEFFCQVKSTYYTLGAHMSILIGALHVSTVEFFILFETSNGRDANMIN
jgi:hypothetical protein